MQNVQLLIHGQSVDASNQATFERISPIDGTVATKAAAATLEDVENAIEEAGPDASNARVSRHKWSYTMTRLGDIPPKEITADLLAGLTAEEFGIIKGTEAALLKKLVASSAETSAASEK